MPVSIDGHDDRRRGCGQLLALHGVRRSVESVAPTVGAAGDEPMALIPHMPP
jgi:hypothetical protein